ncbi:MAG: endolytic transglycosylase MltG [Ignavibacteria bacterium]|nr:endolytic transglycosylase MltG [Ignavibacteria bacterium]
MIVFGFLAVVGGIIIYEILWAPNTFDGDRFITVSRGETFKQVIDSLEHAGVIRNRVLFDIAGRLRGLTTTMQIGKYRFKTGMSNSEILRDIHLGTTTELITIHIPEGVRASRQAHIFARSLGIDSARFMYLVNDSSFAHSIGASSNSLTGYLTPNTYTFYWQTDEEEIIKTQVSEFWKIFDDTLRERASDLGLSVNEILTMASIIELETSIDSERAVIAGVYYNRLRKHMRLQADPTVQFILDDGPRRLHYSDLDRESAYNTYLHPGLPPSPINNPGDASILAALYPTRHKYLFFVANGWGGHKFSQTFSEHKRAIQNYRKFREVQQVLREEG